MGDPWRNRSTAFSTFFLRNVLILLGVLLLSQAVITAFQIKESMEEQVEENLESRAEAIAGESTSSF